MNFRTLFAIVVGFNFMNGHVCAQEISTGLQQQLEQQAERDDTKLEDDDFLLDMDRYRNSPVRLNSADAEDLRGLRMLSDLQISQFLNYRRLLGNFISVYELQAIPGWDVETIRKIFPFCITGDGSAQDERMADRFRRGSQLLVWKITHTPAGLQDTAVSASPFRVLARYRYTFKNLLQFGLVAEKDAGEGFFGKSQPTGFDFYSFHFFARKLGVVRAVAVGDFTINMGQGLIQWQSLSFGKGAEIASLKHQSAVLRPYNSAGEINFQRGVGITIVRRKLEWTCFASLRKMDANLDSADGQAVITSFLNSGLHRLPAELAKKGNISQFSYGSTLAFRRQNGHVAINFINYHFSLPLKKADAPYNLYAIQGQAWYNGSVDFSRTIRNIHLFGEAAIDRRKHTAVLVGLLASVAPAVDLALVARKIEPAYRAIQADAFTENTNVENETGVYWGIALRPASAIAISAYADFFRFPWLRYGVDAPSGGRDWMLQVVYKAGRSASLLVRLRSRLKDDNSAGEGEHFHGMERIGRQSLRLHAEMQATRALLLRTRVEWGMGLSAVENIDNEQVDLAEQAGFTGKGWLIFMDANWKPGRSGWTLTGRITSFQTDGYAARIYAYESDLRYGYGMTALYGSGVKAYVLAGKNIRKNIYLSGRYAIVWKEDVDGGRAVVPEWRLQVAWTL